MTVKVKYFASLREQMGRSEECIEHEPNLTALGVWQRVSGNRTVDEHVLTAVNFEYVESTHAIADGDEVAFFPPVTGG